MTYQVIVQPSAEEDLRTAYAWYRQEAPHKADAWLAGIEAVIDSLCEFPDRCGPAPEDPHFTRPIRQLFFGKADGRYRILFTVDRQTVHILHVRRGARRRLHEFDQR